MRKSISILIILFLCQAPINVSPLVIEHKILVERQPQPRFNTLINALIKKHSAQLGVPYELCLRVARIETGYYTTYKDYNPFQRSYKNAIGPFQVLLPTAKYMLKDRYVSEIELMYNLDLNVYVGILYLKYLYREFNHWGYAIASYNYGPGNVGKKYTGNFIVDRQKYPQETRKYLGRTEAWF